LRCVSNAKRGFRPALGSPLPTSGVSPVRGLTGGIRAAPWPLGQWLTLGYLIDPHPNLFKVVGVSRQRGL
jgi:hypothetical protein